MEETDTTLVSFFGDYDDYKFLRDFGLLFESREDDCSDMLTHFRILVQFEEILKDIPIVKRTREAIEEHWNRFILYDCCCDLLNKNESGLSSTFSCLFDDEYANHFVREIMQREHPLYKEGYIGIYVNGDLSTATIRLTHKARTLLLGENATEYLLG